MSIDQKTILLVDDDDAHLLWSSEVLSDQGYDTILTSSVAEAIAILKDRPVDLIISDLVMPEMSGTDFMREVASFRENQKAIIMTGHGDIETFIESVYDLGALEYIVKPVEADEFIKMVEKLTSPSEDLAANG